MKLKVFYASDGDCLLLSSKDDHHMLIDGGRAGSFARCTRPHLQDLADAGEELDLVVVSHIDADHISGILTLLRDYAAWVVHDFQTTDGGNPSFPKPDAPRPPTINQLWHNSWRAQLGDLNGPIEALVGRIAASLELAPLDEATASAPAIRAVRAMEDLAESIPDGIELLRLVDDDTPIPRNQGFTNLVLLGHPAHVEQLGAARLTVIGPAKKHIERLRQDWRDWLDKQSAHHAPTPPVDERASEPIEGHRLGIGATEFARAVQASAASASAVVSSLVNAAQILDQVDSSAVTPPNRASITILAEEDGKRCLLTGDAAEEEILEGLEAAGFINGGPMWCDVIKVQHHGSEYNLSKRFVERVVGAHYVFCADGANNNPDPSVVKTVVATRLAADQRPFTVWFNCSPPRTLAKRRKALRAGIREATKLAAKHPNQVTVKVLDAGDDFFEIEV